MKKITCFIMITLLVLCVALTASSCELNGKQKDDENKPYDDSEYTAVMVSEYDTVVSKLEAAYEKTKDKNISYVGETKLTSKEGEQSTTASETLKFLFDVSDESDVVMYAFVAVSSSVKNADDEETKTDVSCDCYYRMKDAAAYYRVDTKSVSTISEMTRTDKFKMTIKMTDLEKLGELYTGIASTSGLSADAVYDFESLLKVIKSNSAKLYVSGENKIKIEYTVVRTYGGVAIEKNYVIYATYGESGYKIRCESTGSSDVNNLKGESTVDITTTNDKVSIPAEVYNYKDISGNK